MKNIIKIGTRKSKLALIQTDIVKDKIKKAFPEIEVEIVKIDTYFIWWKRCIYC